MLDVGVEVEPWFPLWVMGGWWPRAEKMDLGGEEEERKGGGKETEGQRGRRCQWRQLKRSWLISFWKSCVCVFNLLTIIFIKKYLFIWQSLVSVVAFGVFTTKCEIFPCGIWTPAHKGSVIEVRELFLCSM